MLGELVPTAWDESFHTVWMAWYRKAADPPIRTPAA
jgi:hypothetical protein